MGLMWTILRKDDDLEEPTPSWNQVYVGFTQGEAEVDNHVVQANVDLFRRITTTEVTNEQRHEKYKIL